MLLNIKSSTTAQEERFQWDLFSQGCSSCAKKSLKFKRHTMKSCEVESMEQKPTWQASVIIFLIIASIPFFSKNSSNAGYLAEQYFSSYVYKIGDTGLRLLCEIVVLLLSLAIIVFIPAVAIAQLKYHIKKKSLYLLLTPFNLLKYFVSLHVLGFLVSFSIFTIDTIKKMMM